MAMDMGPMHFTTLLRRWWWLLGLGIFLGAAGGYAMSAREVPQYQASTRLFINQAQSPGPASYNDVLASEQLAGTYGQLLHGQQIMSAVIDQLALPFTPDGLRARTSATAIRDTQLLQITARDTDPARAARIADACAQALSQQAQGLQMGVLQSVRRQADESVAAAQQRLSETQGRLQALQATPIPNGNFAGLDAQQHLESQLALDQDAYRRALDARQQIATAQLQTAGSLTVAEPARASTAAVAPLPKRTAIVGGLVGGLIALALASLLAFLVGRIDGPQEIARRCAAPVLATFGRRRGVDDPARLLDLDVPGFSRARESVRALRTNLHAVAGNAPVVVCVSGVDRDEQARTLAANLALLEAHAGKRVVLVDANLRRPGLHTLLALPNTRGLSTFLAASPGAEPHLLDGPKGLQVLTAGAASADAPELLDSPRMAQLIAMLRDDADLVILAGAPVRDLTDALVLQRLVDGTVLVADLLSVTTQRRSVDEAVSTVRGATGTVFGIVFMGDKRRKSNDGAYRVAPAAGEHEMAEKAAGSVRGEAVSVRADGAR